MTPSEWIENMEIDLKEFPSDKFRKSCLIHSKSNYGVFLLEDLRGEKYAVKVSSFSQKDLREDLKESIINLYVRKFINFVPITIYNVISVYIFVHQ